MLDSPSGDVTLTIQDVGFGGQGVGRLPDGRVVFVPRTLYGETVRVQLRKAGKNFVEADLRDILQPSPCRVAAPCRYFKDCGGCAYQHAAYPEQLRMKEKQVRDLLARIGGMKAPPPIHVQAASRVHGYRNKIVVHQGPNNELGFYALDKRNILDIEECWIATGRVNRKLADLRKQKRRPRHASLLDQDERAGTDEGSFHQVNTEMAENLRSWIHGRVAEGKGKATMLLELYCGTGFFTLGMADGFQRICGVDRDERAIHAAVARARDQGIRHAHFIAADVDERIRHLLEPCASERLVVLADPPREGLPRNVAEALLEAANIDRLIYISCNPSTLARDLKTLCASDLEGGASSPPSTGRERGGDEAPPSTRQPRNFSLSQLGLFDMFPQTAHIEIVAFLERS
jgi:23S rRNA (uracil1939-C5)-methyltransferase